MTFSGGSVLDYIWASGKLQTMPWIVDDRVLHKWRRQAWPSLEKASAGQSKTEGSADIDGVRRIFSALSHFFDAVAGQFQVIVTEHAGAITWDGIPHVHLVSNWRHGHDEFLIPAAWLKAREGG